MDTYRTVNDQAVRALTKKTKSEIGSHHGIYHGGAACCASSNMAFAIETKPLPPHVCDGLVKGAVEGFHIN